MWDLLEVSFLKTTVWHDNRFAKWSLVVSDVEWDWRGLAAGFLNKWKLLSSELPRRYLTFLGSRWKAGL